VPVGPGIGCHDAVVRRSPVWACLAVVVLAACSSSGSKASPSTTSSPPTGSTSTAVSTTTPITVAPSTSSTTAAVVTSTTAVVCPQPAGPAVPVTTPKSAGSSLLTSVSVAGAPCTDKVIFGFLAKSGGTPNCTVGYQNGPFTEDASGKSVTVLGAAFAVVRCTSAYTYDPATNRTTYTGPKSIIPSSARYVREVVKIGDFEGVLSWVVGLSERRAFKVAVASVPPGISNLTITFS
jgi:hypothetical protein